MIMNNRSVAWKDVNRLFSIAEQVNHRCEIECRERMLIG